MNNITVLERIPVSYDSVNVEYSYEELLDLFSGNDNVVKPLVLRCIEYEERLAMILQRIAFFA